MIETNKRVVPKGEPIVIPGAAFMSKEELAKAKKNESQRRLMARRRGKEPLERTTKQELRKISHESLMELVTDSRNLTVEVLMKKLGQLMTDDEQLSKTNLVQITTALGTLVDKVQLLRGLATSNVAIHAKIDLNMTSSEALEQLNKMREGYQNDSNK